MRRCRRTWRPYSMPWRGAASRARPGAPLGKAVAGAAQRPGQPDERQADERRGVAALDVLEQRDAERLGLEAPGAIERLLARHVALDLLGTEGAEHYRGGIDVRGVHARAGAGQRAGGMEQRGPAAE